MSARTEIENALYRWAWAYDECDLEAFVDSVTEDATVTIEVVTGMVIEQLQGRDAVRAFFGDRLAIRTESRRHVTTNVIIDEESADEARTRCYLTMIQVSDGKPHVIGSGCY